MLSVVGTAFRITLYALVFLAASGSGLLRADDTVPAEQQPPRPWDELRLREIERDPEKPPLAEARLESRTEPYTGLLTAGYIAAPLLGVGIPLLLGSLQSDNDTLLFALDLTVMLGATFIPAIVHWSQGEGSRRRGGLPGAGAPRR